MLPCDGGNSAELYAFALQTKIDIDMRYAILSRHAS